MKILESAPAEAMSEEDGNSTEAVTSGQTCSPGNNETVQKVREQFCWENRECPAQHGGKSRGLILILDVTIATLWNINVIDIKL